MNNSETKIISAQGWADKSSICVIGVQDKSISKFNLEENAEYVEVRKVQNDHFLCYHHFNGNKIIFTIHSFDKPDLILGRIEINNQNTNFKVDQSLWQYVPRFIVEWFKYNKNEDYYLLEIDPEKNQVNFHVIDWFNSEEYDLGYQGLYEVIEIPRTNLLLFPIQRSSRPVLYDFSKKTVIGKLKLAGRAGNPSFKFRKHDSELWTVDYDTLVKLEVGSWKLLKSKNFQFPLMGHTMTFVGDFAFTPNEEYCALARPYSKDILLLDADNMKEVGKIKSKYQPLQVAVLSNYECVYRDWQTGKFDFQSFPLKRLVKR